MKINKLNTLAPILLGLGAFWLIQPLWHTHSFCYFKATIGIPCPGCGMTRAFLDLFKGDFHGAFRWHPLWPMVLMYPALHVCSGFTKWKEALQQKWIPLMVLFLFMGTYVIRMYSHFPTETPLDYNKHAILYQLWNLIKNIR